MYRLFIFIAACLSLASFAETTAQSPEEAYYERIYSFCAYSYSSSKLTETEVDCLCNQLANHALMNQDKIPAGKIPTLPEDMKAACLGAP